MTADADFFEEPEEHSKLKARIVAKYFAAWANVIVPQVKKARGNDSKIGYFDLFAGTGKYKDGTKSTPILILEQAVQKDALRNSLVSFFNDHDANSCKELEKAIHEIPGIKTLKYAPDIFCKTVGQEIIDIFKGLKMIPSLIFLDPWGYKGLCLDLINAVIKDWACECIFFFNYLRVNAAIQNDYMRDHVDGLFGKNRAARLRVDVHGAEPWDREEKIMEELIAALKETHGKYVLKFRFRSPEKNRTSHYLVFVTKNFLGYEIMKDTMAGFSSEKPQGVPTFEFDPTVAKEPKLFDMRTPLDALVAALPKDFAGQNLVMSRVYERHNVGTPYIKSNYKAALLTLERAGRVTAEPPAAKRRKDTFGDDVIVRFPKVNQ